MKSDLPEIKGTRLLLRRPISQDVDTRLALGRHKEIVEAYGGTFDPTASFGRSHAEAAVLFIEEQDYAWVVDAGRFIGHVSSGTKSQAFTTAEVSPKCHNGLRFESAAKSGLASESKL
jgi:hypothetical protein